MKINHLLKQGLLDTYLYNLNLTLDKKTLDKFSGIKYVLMQGSQLRAKNLSMKLSQKILNINGTFFEPINLIETSKFYAYRTGNILSVSHGMGNTSIITLLHNLTQVLYFAGNSDLEYIRIGTSGGIGVEPGSVVLTDTAYMPNLIAGYKVSALGKDIIYPTVMDKVLNQKILQAQHQSTSFKLLVGNSIAADDFYLGQARFDGAFEMESTGLASFCNRAQIPATMIASIIINRLNGDQVTISTETLNKYSDHSQEVAINYVLCNQHNLNK